MKLCPDRLDARHIRSMTTLSKKDFASSFSFLTDDEGQGRQTSYRCYCGMQENTPKLDMNDMMFIAYWDEGGYIRRCWLGCRSMTDHDRSCLGL